MGFREELNGAAWGVAELMKRRVGVLAGSHYVFSVTSHDKNAATSTISLNTLATYP